MQLLRIDQKALQECIDTCIKCAQACNQCFKSCLEKENLRELKEALSILVDCAEICYITAACLTRDNNIAGELCTSCAELCEKCMEICCQQEDLHCQASVEACRKCAKMCLHIAQKL